MTYPADPASAVQQLTLGDLLPLMAKGAALTFEEMLAGLSDEELIAAAFKDSIEPADRLPPGYPSSSVR